MVRVLPFSLALALLLSACDRPAAPAEPDARPAAAAEPDLLGVMLYMQRFLEKTALSVEAGNWPLAERYAHELEEAAEGLEGATHDGVDLWALTESSFLPAHERLEQALAVRDRAGYDRALADLVQSCNACHAAAGYGDVRIVVPADFSRPSPSQDFAPAAPVAPAP
jgi:hypothetical protein